MNVRSELGPDDAGILLVVGETAVASRVCATLRAARPGMGVRHLVAPSDAELASALSERVLGAAVLIRNDVAALRYALTLAHLDPGLPVTVSIFDRTLAEQLRAFLPQITVISPAALATPSLVGPCLEQEFVAAFSKSEERLAVVQDADGLPVDRPLPRASRSRVSRTLRALRWAHRHQDAGTRLLLIGAIGLSLVLLVDWLWLVTIEHHGVAASFQDAARVVATVGPAPTDVGATYGVLAACAMLLTVVLTSFFTAGLIDRLLEPRLLGLVGPRTPPSKDHVIVVGMGQVGVRLCAQLKADEVAVVGVERDSRAPHLPLARQMGIPVVIGSGTERQLLERLGLDRCRALAAVGSDDLDNIAVAVTAAAVSRSTRVVLRAGEHDAIAETRSLLPLGVIRDVTEIAATFVVAQLLGKDVAGVVTAGGDTYLQTSAGYQRLNVSKKDQCRHSARELVDT